MHVSSETQTVGSPTGQISTFETQDGKFFRSFLIGTKRNDAEWFIRRETGHDKVKSFIDRDFAIIPELIHKPIQQGGGGHIKGTREQILKGYADNSHGKIRELVGPFYYTDSPQDYWYDQITQLSDSRSASVLHREGQKTWNGYDVSPHIFVNKGSDAEGWEDWEGAGLNLVIKGAFGNQSIITKFCDGTKAQCFKDLMASTAKITDESIAELLTSHLSKFASTPHSMPDNQTNKPDSGLPDSGLATKDKNKSNPTVDPQKDLTTAPIIGDKVEVSKEEWDRIRERADAVTEMENERKQEILGGLFAVIDDEKEREKEIKDYAKLDMKTVKMLKLYSEKRDAKLKEIVKAQLKAEAKEEEEKEDENGNGEKDAKKKAKEKEKEKDKERSASSSGHLDKEPKHPKFTSPDYNPEDNKDGERHASVPEIRNEVYLLRQKFLKGRGNRED
jgi:hypothetical protein